MAHANVYVVYQRVFHCVPSNTFGMWYSSDLCLKAMCERGTTGYTDCLQLTWTSNQGTIRLSRVCNYSQSQVIIGKLKQAPYLEISIIK